MAGVGARPRDELARAAGLTVSDGVEVDEYLRTSDPDVFAIGDVAAAWHPLLDARVRVEHWDTARRHGIAVAKSMLDAGTPYRKAPYFYSDQYDFDMEYVGHPARWDRLLFRGEPASGSFCAFWLDGSTVVAGLNARVPGVSPTIAKLIESGAKVDPAPRCQTLVRPLESLCCRQPPREERTCPCKIGWVEVAEGVFVRRYPFLDQNIGVIVGEARRPGRRLASHRGPRARDPGRSTRRSRRGLRPWSSTPTPTGITASAIAPSGRPRSGATRAPSRSWRGRSTTSGRRRSSQTPTSPPRWPSFVPDPPDQTFADAATIDLGGRIVELRFLGRGHTDHDIVVVRAGADVVFAGDLIEGGNPPSFDDGYPIDWPATDDALLALAAARYVPGHGPVFDHADVAAQADEVRQVVDLAERVYEGHLEFEQAVVLAPWPPDDARQPIARGVGQLRGDLD